VRCLCEWHLSLSLSLACVFFTGNCLTFVPKHVFRVFISRKAEKPPHFLTKRHKKERDHHVRVNRRGVDEQRERVRAFEFTTFLFATTALVAKERSSRRRTHESTTKIRVFEEDRRRRFFSLGVVVVFVRGRRRRDERQHRAERSRRQRATTKSPGRRVAPTARPRSRR